MSTKLKQITLDMIGIVFLSIIISIEYYNNIVFNGGYNPVINEINYFLRTSLWKIHLGVGIALYIVFVTKYLIDKNVYINRLLVIASFFVLISGILTYFIYNNLLHIEHILFIVLATAIYLLSVTKNIFGVYYAL